MIPTFKSFHVSSEKNTKSGFLAYHYSVLFMCQTWGWLIRNAHSGWEHEFWSQTEFEWCSDPRCYLIALCLNFLMCKIKMTTSVGLLWRLNKFIYKKQLNIFVCTANYVSASFITFVQIFKIYLVGLQTIIIEELHKNKQNMRKNTYRICGWREAALNKIFKCGLQNEVFIWNRFLGNFFCWQRLHMLEETVP